MLTKSEKIERKRRSEKILIYFSTPRRLSARARREEEDAKPMIQGSLSCHFFPVLMDCFVYILPSKVNYACFVPFLMKIKKNP